MLVLLVVVGAVAIITPKFTLWVSNPFVPVTDSVKEPVDEDELALTVRVDVAVDPEGGVTGPGRLMDTPEGAVPIHE